MSKPFTQKATVDSTLTTAYRNPYANNYYHWYGHERLHNHVTRQATRAEPINEPDVLHFLSQAYPTNQTRAMKPTVEQFKKFYAKQRKRLMNFRKDIEKCVSLLAPAKPTYIIVRAPAYGRKKRYIIQLYTTPNDDLLSWTEEVANYNKTVSWIAKERVVGAQRYADFMKSLNDNINYLTTFDPTPHIEKHMANIEDEEGKSRIRAAQSFIKSNLQKIAGHEVDLCSWSDSEYIREHAAKQRLYHIENITQATERVKQYVKTLIELGVELTEEQQSFAPEVTE